MDGKSEYRIGLDRLYRKGTEGKGRDRTGQEWIGAAGKDETVKIFGFDGADDVVNMIKRVSSN